MKKPHRKLIIILACVILIPAAGIIRYAVYIGTSLSPEDGRAYVIEHSDRKATEFLVCTLNGNLYYIPKNGDTTKPQELFVFKELPLSGRLKFIDEAKMGKDVGVYSYPSPQGEEYGLELENRVYFFANEKHICRCIYVISTNGIEMTYEKGFPSESPYLFELENIGTAFNVTTKIINLKFYDVDGNLVAEFDTPDHSPVY